MPRGRYPSSPAMTLGVLSAVVPIFRRAPRRLFGSWAVTSYAASATYSVLSSVLIEIPTGPPSEWPTRTTVPSAATPKTAGEPSSWAT